ncbi:hypothetical protein V6N11_013961 [Hibiscus sabdariffa]|uniref:Cytochrome P450 n=1 Tax=Hibiscus sabdariffa TaxID=183260 RepID=A0ABR2A2H6_9ROSI
MAIFVHYLSILLITTVFSVVSFLLHRANRLRRLRLPPGNLGLPFPRGDLTAYICLQDRKPRTVRRQKGEAVRFDLHNAYFRRTDCLFSRSGDEPVHLAKRREAFRV